MWVCRNGQELIKSDKLCDKEMDCMDESDEHPSICFGTNARFVLILKCVLITLLVVGYLFSAIMFGTSMAIGREDKLLCDGNQLNSEDNECYKEIFEVCKQFQPWNDFNTGNRPNVGDFSAIIE